jgi:succinate--hydroxymethylglutarate CoA-transferase
LWARGIATTKKEVNEKLPLAGIRVLDMTRVLAGVCLYYIGS